MNGTFLQLDPSRFFTQHQMFFPTIYNTYNFDDIKILVIWPKSAILKMGQKGLSQGPIDGAFFLVIPDMFLGLCAKFYLYMIFV